MGEIDRIARLLNKTFNKGAWYGPTVREVLAQVTPELAHVRAGKTHSIVELVLHMTAWRKFAASRLSGNNDFQVSEQANFPSAKSISWEQAVQDLETSQKNLEEAVSNFEEAKLGDLVPATSHKYTYYTLLHGIIHHDIYHAGQIQLLIRANPGQ